MAPDEVYLALERQRRFREQGSTTMPAEQAWKDAEVLGREVERLQHRIGIVADALSLAWVLPNARDIDPLKMADRLRSILLNTSDQEPS